MIILNIFFLFFSSGKESPVTLATQTEEIAPKETASKATQSHGEPPPFSPPQLLETVSSTEIATNENESEAFNGISSSVIEDANDILSTGRVLNGDIQDSLCPISNTCENGDPTNIVNDHDSR